MTKNTIHIIAPLGNPAKVIPERRISSPYETED